MKALNIIIVVLALIGIWLGGYLVGRGILYLTEHTEQRIRAIDVIEKGKTSGFAKAIINEE